MHKVKQFKVNAKTLPGFWTGTDYRAFHRKQSRFGIELGADTRLELVILGYEPNVMPFH